MRIADLPQSRALLAFGLFLANLSPAEAAPRLVARSWQSEDGLPSNVVRAVAQATDGYLWVGTAEGVVRFDGQRFTGFREEADPTLAREYIRALFPLPNGEVWVTTASNKLLRGRGARLEAIPLPASNDRPPIISQVIVGDERKVFIARGTEVWQIEDGEKPRLSERTAALEKLLQQDAAGEPERGRVTGSVGAAVRLRDTRGELWQFQSGAGLTLTDTDGHTKPPSVQTQLPSTVQAMHEDREGNLWLGTHSQGLWRLRPSRVEVLTTADGLSDRTARLVREDQAGALWVAPQSGGLDCISSGAVRHFEVGPARERETIAALLETRAGVLWAATQNRRVYSWKDGGFINPFPTGTGPSRIVAMAEDEQGRIWLGGRSGLGVWDGQSRRTIKFGASEVVTAMVSAGETIWVGTESGRVFRSEGERLDAVGASDAFARRPISSLLPDAEGSLWVGTMGSGLFHLRENRVVALAPRMSAVDPRITCVLDDGGGFLWLGTRGGICRVEKEKLLQGPSAPFGSTLVLDRSDGLLSRECTSGYPAGWRGHDGTLYFSTGHGVACVRPEGLALNTVPPPVVIEESSAGGQPFAPIAGRMQAGPGRARLEFRYTALTFTAPEKVRFRTLLEGLDETWRDADGRRTAAYEAVPPGRYRFRVIAENGDGVWNETGAALAVEVLPHFWETLWFRVAVAFAGAAFAVGIGALITRARMRGRLLRLEAQTSREKERARIARDMHDDLGASLTRIALMSDLGSFKPEGDGTAAKRFGEIGKVARSVSSTLDQIVWTVNPHNDTVERLVGYLGEFVTEYLESAGIPLKLELPPAVRPIPVPSDVRHEVLLAVKEALNNIVKYAEASTVSVRVVFERGELGIVITDDGRGFDTTAVSSSSNGLRNMKERFAAMGGAAQIESCVGTGTSVTFRVRLG